MGQATELAPLGTKSRRATMTTIVCGTVWRSLWWTESQASTRFSGELLIAKTTTSSCWKVLRRSRHDTHQEPNAAKGYERNRIDLSN